MNYNCIRWGRLFAALFALATTAQPFYGQGITASGLSGTVEGPDGDGIGGATITAVHVPTGTSYRATTSGTGHYAINNMRPGGPYTITASSNIFEDASINNVYLELSRIFTQDFGVSQATGDVIELEDYIVTATAGQIFSDDNMGNFTELGGPELAAIPLVRRNINDLARFNPFVAINENDRNELVAAGQNTRFNSIKIDGVTVNDQFGLEASGQVSLRSPVSVETVESVAVEVAPFDVRQAGFTGATINVRTKNGSNRFGGSLYYYFTNQDLRGPNDPDFEETTWGATFSGPIVQDTLFFFLHYEDFELSNPGGEPFYTPDPDALADVAARSSELGLDFGSFRQPSDLATTEEKYTGKLSWNINDNHTLDLKYSSNEGVVINLGNFDDFGETSLDTGFYTQLKEAENYTAQLYSQWTGELSSEISFGYNKYRQPTTFDRPLPQIFIDRFPADDGVAGSYGEPGNTELYFGTEQFRHQNNLDWDSYRFSTAFDYLLGDHTVTFGFDVETTEFSNLFLESAFGNFNYNTLDDFLNDQISSLGFLRSYRNTGVVGQNPVAEPEYAVWGFFLQNSWNATDRLKLLAGLRVDLTTSDTRPPEAFTADGRSFESLFGFANNGSIDGEFVVSPRLGFNYKLREDINSQIRGGIGLFQGRSPAVWFSNAFTNNGETSNRITFDPATFSLDEYVANDFDPADPVIFIEKAEGVPVVDAIEDGAQLPSAWKADLAFDQQIGQSSWVFTAELLYTKTNQSFWVQNANLNEVGRSPDGRVIFDGRVHPEFSDVYYLRNTSEGDAWNLSAQIRREFKDNWYLDFSLTYGRSDDVNPFTSSRAVSNYVNQSVFNQNTEESGTSNYELRYRALFRAGYVFKWAEGWDTDVSVVMDARTGRPYSVNFNNDFNGDNIAGNDVFYVPTGPNDPIVTFAEEFPVVEFFDFLAAEGLDAYAGSHVPRNAERNKNVYRWDIKVRQSVPIYGPAKFELFFDILNVGNLIDEDWGLVEEYSFPFHRDIADGRITDNNLIEYSRFDPDEPSVRVGTYRSRWHIQLGGRLSF